ncbi:hypothetical protein HCN44_003741 [Aphidius gifuensis]|uniref:Peptidase S1 domain-containing protein n=1 Tax=Aphidius gifuensis TaxID=684658 RepID=A0A834XKG6_APHGI|nr:hypothetical protein HCN44_003741 [Aphidius gifuensis]
MKSSIIQTLILFSFQILAGSAKSSKKIHNGILTRSHEFEFEVSIKYRFAHLCAGSIITTRHVITSASCVTAEPYVIYANLKILSGTKDVTGESSGNFHQVSQVAIHKNYEPTNCWRNDIAILKIKSRFIFNRFRQKATLPFYNFVPKSLLVAGWGGIDGNINRFLNKIGILSLRSDSRCQSAFSAYNFVHATQLCGTPTDFQARITHGDGGGPVISIDNENLIAVVSASILNTLGFPMISTLIYPFLDFINEIITTY